MTSITILVRAAIIIILSQIAGPVPTNSRNSITAISQWVIHFWVVQVWPILTWQSAINPWLGQALLPGIHPLGRIIKFRLINQTFKYDIPS